MRLRKLELKDAPLMLEWMHDESVVKGLQTDFASKTIDDCKKFITSSWGNNENLNLAIADENDVYMGTVSLKNITKSSAEFAITIRTTAMGKGYSKVAMAEIIRIGIEDMGLDEVYWCVSKDNPRAVRFYDKNGYQRVEAKDLKEIRGSYTEQQINSYLWYVKRK